MTNPIPDPQLNLWEIGDVMLGVAHLLFEVWLQTPFALMAEADRLANLHRISTVS